MPITAPTDSDIAPFGNEPTLDFNRAHVRGEFEQALARVREQMGQRYPMVIAGREEGASTEFSATCPADPSRVVGRFPSGDSTAAVRALEAADAAFPAWSQVRARERADYLFRAANEVRRRRLELAAWMVFEVGKSWAEADGEVAECVDLIDYYARRMVALDGSQTTTLATLPGESTDFFYIPLGAGAVISPWNFPMALTFGMASAAIVAGNTVVIKPASTSPTSVHQLARAFEAAGLPSGVMNIVTGPGGLIGDTLVDHPRTRFVAFTGSMEIGVRIHERAAKVHPGQIWIKRTVLEMGGKNAVIVAGDADLDAAAEGVVASAFGFQGQKCSAGSRAIIDQAVYDEFVPLILERAAKLRVGDPIDPEVTVGPVITASARDAILRFIEIGKTECTLLLGGGRVDAPGYLIQPTIFGDVDPNATVAQDEIFGPVLACIKARDFDHALQIANGTRFGLTGAVFSRDRAKLERARREFHVGNLYFNRKSTGALMGVHPFGGFNMSGTDSKAGGPDYLLLFLQGKSIGDRIV